MNYFLYFTNSFFSVFLCVCVKMKYITTSASAVELWDLKHKKVVKSLTINSIL